VSIAEFERLRHAALDLSCDEALGLHLVEGVQSVEFDVLGHLTAHAATLRQAIDTLARYSGIVVAGPKAEVVEEGDTAWVRFAFRRGEARPKIRFAAELALSGLVRMIRTFGGPAAQARAAYFAYPPPAYRAEYTRVLGGIEQFDHAFTGVEFERAWLDRVQPYQNSELYTVLKTQADRTLWRLAREETLVARVTAHLDSRSPRAMPTMSEVAREFGMSARSLRRRLMDEGAVYKDMVDRILLREAKRMLESPQMSIQETAYATGFATPAAFHRAFKRWTGMTPKEYKASF
jgi:AraC-like DNA-binding protein